MKKEDLLKLGLDEENAKKIADASTEELKGYIPKARFDEVNNEKKKLELDVRDRDGQLETLKNSTGDVEGMKKRIETLQAENKTKDEKHAAELKQLKIEAAVSAALSSSKAKNEKAVKALLDLTKAELADDGSIKGLAEQLKKLAESEDSKFLFDADTKPKVAGIKPAEGKAFGQGTITKEQFNKMGYKERLELYSSNKDVYNSFTKLE